MIGLGAVAFGFVLSLGDTAITEDIVQQFLDSTGEADVGGLGALVAGVRVVMSLVCSAICGLLVAIPTTYDWKRSRVIRFKWDN